MHWPDALHVDGPVYTSDTQASGAHTVVLAAYLRQPPVPSHLPSVPHVAAVMSVQVSRGSAAPNAAMVHLPMAPASAQLRHAPVHAVLQQTPSTQCWFWQSVLAAHFCPSSFGPQLPVATMHEFPSAQSASEVHLEMQPPFAHLYFPHCWISDA
jgi:hypothetical protein